MTRSAVGICVRKRRLWPRRDLRLPPGGPPVAVPDANDAAEAPAGTLTARELIAMARAARLGRRT